jgi:transcriptional regulator with XRE-family HTH domain
MKYPILESAIIKYGIPKKQLAEELGLTQAGISRKFVGKSNFTLEEAFYIADRLGSTVDELFREKSKIQPAKSRLDAQEIHDLTLKAIRDIREAEQLQSDKT